MDVWDRKVPTSGPTPRQFDDDDDDIFGIIKLYSKNFSLSYNQWNACYKFTYGLGLFKFNMEYIYVPFFYSAVGIATRYGLDGPGIESR